MWILRLRFVAIACSDWETANQLYLCNYTTFMSYRGQSLVMVGGSSIKFTMSRSQYLFEAERKAKGQPTSAGERGGVAPGRD